MSNHSSNCPYCGADQRLQGFGCCEEFARDQRHAASLRDATQLRRRALCEAFGIRYSISAGSREVVPNPESFTAFLEELIARMPPLKPR
jgi:hypothetical protein